MKIAIIGTGISGLGSAYLLNKDHDITVYEKNDYIGGHSRTVDIETLEAGQTVSVDTGFIVFNHRSYPHLTKLFNHLNVPITKSDMSFGVSIDKGYFEYGARRAVDIFAQKSNFLRPKFWRMLWDVFKFNREAKKYLDSNLSLKELLDELDLGDWFRAYYLLAMGACIWSTPTSGMLDFLASSFIRFFDNHGLLTVMDQPQWYTVDGGSKEYVRRLIASFQDKIKLGCGVKSVIRNENYVEIIDTDGNHRKVDQVVFACHTDQVLKLLHQPTTDEKEIIGSIEYQPNEMILHSDTNFMPKRKNAWASWVYLSESKKDQSKVVSLSYWMNNLQPLKTKKDIFVTLNPGHEPDPNKVYDKYTFHHPVFEKKTIEAQNNLDKIQGVNRTWYTGAWQRYGFHEDGIWSAVNVAEKMKVKIPWG